MKFQEQLTEFLVNGHVASIKNEVLLPAIGQIIDDLEDAVYVSRVVEGEEKAKVEKEIALWKVIKILTRCV